MLLRLGLPPGIRGIPAVLLWAALGCRPVCAASVRAARAIRQLICRSISKNLSQSLLQRRDRDRILAMEGRNEDISVILDRRHSGDGNARLDPGALCRAAHRGTDIA